MKMRTLSLMIALTAVASGAMASEIIQAACHRVPHDRVHQALGFDGPGRLPVLTGVPVNRAAAMPACSTCH